MATENVSFQDALFIIKNNIVSKANSFSQVVSSSKIHTNTDISSISSFPSSSIKSQTFVDDSFFPPLQNIKYNKSYRNKFAKPTSSSRTPRIPIIVSSVPSPNGSFLTYMESSRNVSANNATPVNSQAPLLSEVASALSNQITTVLSNTQGIDSIPSLSNLIESLLTNMLSVSPAGLNNN